MGCEGKLTYGLFLRWFQTSCLPHPQPEPEHLVPFSVFNFSFFQLGSDFERELPKVRH